MNLPLTVIELMLVELIWQINFWNIQITFDERIMPSVESGLRSSPGIEIDWDAGRSLSMLLLIVPLII